MIADKVKYVAIAICLICFSGIAHADLIQTAGKNRSFDGRFNKKCQKWVNDESKEFCTVSIYRLLAKTEDYNGKLIGITGYLAYDAGTLTIYPTKDRYEAGASEDSIVIFDKEAIPKDIESGLRSGGSYVSLSGEFDATYEGKNFTRSGAIKKLITVNKAWHVRLSEDMP